MRIAICEDSQKDAERLDMMLRQYCADNHFNVSIDIFTSGNALLDRYIPDKYQILFLDILMDGINGIDTANKIRQIDEEVAIIFITVSQEFAVDSYQVNASYYLVKPINDAILSLAMERCRQLILQYAKSIEVIQNRRSVNIKLRNILYLESQRNDCIIVTLYDKIRTRTQLSMIEPDLGGLPFLRCHRSFIVNLRWVDDMTENDFLLRNRIKISISRAYTTSVQQEFHKYLMDDARRESKQNMLSSK